MTPEYIAVLLDFHYWARDRMLDAVGALSREDYERDLGSSFKSVRDTVNHIYSSEWVWYARWTGSSPTTADRPQFDDLAAVREAWRKSETRVRKFLGAADAPALQRVYEYRMFSGAQTSSPLWQMAVHVVNHGTYHRGQVATMLRQLGANPMPSTDMVTFFREQRAVSSGQ
jgi:uncharacterized damage-inducible protein DinB